MREARNVDVTFVLAVTLLISWAWCEPQPDRACTPMIKPWQLLRSRAANAAPDIRCVYSYIDG